MFHGTPCPASPDHASQKQYGGPSSSLSLHHVNNSIDFDACNVGLPTHLDDDSVSFDADYFPVVRNPQKKTKVYILNINCPKPKLDFKDFCIPWNPDHAAQQEDC